MPDVHSQANDRTAVAESFLRALIREQPKIDIQLAWVDGGGSPRSKRFPSHQADRAAGEGIRLADRGADVYVRAGGIDHDARLRAGERGGVEYTTVITAVWADLDLRDPDDPKKKDYPRTVEEIRDLLDLEPSILVHSGGGLQGWWLLDEPLLLTTHEIRRRAMRLLEGFQKRLAHDFRLAGYGTDANSFDLARMMRLPGTFNYKKDIPRPVEVIEDSDHRYPVVVLEEFIGDISLGPEADTSGVEDDAGTYPLGGECPAGLVERLRARSPKFGPTWERNRPDLQDQSASGFDLSIAGIAAYHGAEDHEIAALIYHRRLRHGEDPQKALRRDYIARTISAARTRLSTATASSKGGPTSSESPEGATRDDPLTAHPVAIATRIMAEVPVKVGPADTLYVYDAGVWRPGQKDIEVRARELMGPKFTSHRVREVVRFMKNHRQEIWTDREPTEMLNLRNGMVDLATGELHDHDPDLLSTIQLPVAWNPDASGPNIERFLKEVLHDDAVELMLQVIGLAMYPGNPFHTVVALVGGGRNGKSTLLHVMEELVGRPLVSHVSLASLEKNRFAGADLDGKLLNIGSEEAEFASRRTELLKAISGGDTIRVERKGQDAYDIRPLVLPVFATNEPIRTADTSEALSRRLVIIEFPHSFPHGPPADELRASVTTAHELEALTWMAVQALRRALEQGRLDRPVSAMEAHNSYRMRIKAVNVFLGDYCEFDPSFWVSRADLAQALTGWAAHTESAVTVDQVYAALRGLAPQVTERSKKGKGRGFAGLRLRFTPPA